MKVFNNGASITKLKYQGKWLPFRLDLSKPDELALVVDELTEEQAQALSTRIGPLAPTKLVEDSAPETTAPQPITAREEIRDTAQVAQAEQTAQAERSEQAEAEVDQRDPIPAGSGVVQLAGESWQA